MRAKIVVMAVAVLIGSGCAIRMKADGEATFFKRDKRDIVRDAANNALLAQRLLQAGLSPLEVRHQLELANVDAGEAERITAAAAASCGCVVK
jgi:hypothetical protein